MARRLISQREAHAAVKRVAELEQKRNLERAAWGREYPGGINVGHMWVAVDSRFGGKLEGMQLCKRVLVAKYHAENGRLDLYAI